MARKAPTPFLSAARRGGRNVTRLEGMEDLEAAIRQVSEDIQGVALRNAVDGGAEIVRDVASQLAPQSASGSHGREPGFLSKNILKEKQWTRTQDTAVSFVGMEKEKAWYGRFAELGTTYQPAQPFLRPALDETKNDVVKEIAERLRREILAAVR